MTNEKFYIDMFDLGGSLKIMYYYSIIGILLAITGLIEYLILEFSISIYVLSWSFLLWGFLIFIMLIRKKNKYFHWGIVYW